MLLSMYLHNLYCSISIYTYAVLSNVCLTPRGVCNHCWIPGETPIGHFLGIKLLCSFCALFWLIDVIILALGFHCPISGLYLQSVNMSEVHTYGNICRKV